MVNWILRSWASTWWLRLHVPLPSRWGTCFVPRHIWCALVGPWPFWDWVWTLCPPACCCWTEIQHSPQPLVIGQTSQHELVLVYSYASKLRPQLITKSPVVLWNWSKLDKYWESSGIRYVLNHVFTARALCSTGQDNVTDRHSSARAWNRFLPRFLLNSNNSWPHAWASLRWLLLSKSHIKFWSVMPWSNLHFLWVQCFRHHRTQQS